MDHSMMNDIQVGNLSIRNEEIVCPNSWTTHKVEGLYTVLTQTEDLVTTTLKEHFETSNMPFNG